MKTEDIQNAYKELVTLKASWKEKGFDLPEIVTILGLMITNIAIANNIPLAEFQGIILKFFTTLYVKQINIITEEIKHQVQDDIPT